MPNRKTKKLTIKDVARILDVSTATVSNAFNRPDQLSETLRERILSECKKLGYVGPSAAGRILRTGRSGVVGIVLTDGLSYSISDYVASHFIAGLAEVFDEAHLNMLLLSARDMDQSTRQRQHESMVDGYIAYGMIDSEGRTYEHLLRQQKRLIVVDNSIEGYPSINVDNRGAAREIASYALKQKPENLAILGLRVTNFPRISRLTQEDIESAPATISVDRLNGYFEAITAAGVELPLDRIWNIPLNTHRWAYQAASEALNTLPRPDLVLCMSDVIAMATLQTALKMGLRVPEDLRIVGFDGIPEAQNIHPSITTVQQHSTEKGRRAARMFLDVGANEDLVLTTELLIGGSCP